MEINTNMHLLELSTMIHVVRKQIKCILVNERPRDNSLGLLCDLICRVYQSVNGTNVLLVSEKNTKTNNTLAYMCMRMYAS